MHSFLTKRKIEIVGEGELSNKIEVKSRESLEYFLLAPVNVNVEKINRTIILEDGAVLKARFFYFGKVDGGINIELKAGRGAQIDYKVFFVACGAQKLNFKENYNFTDQASFGRFVARGIALENAAASFHGNIIVKRAAAKTDAGLDLSSLIFGTEARVNMTPNLQISANDVQVNHCASMAKFNDEQVFYLSSRGISKLEAQKLLIESMIKYDELPREFSLIVRKSYKEIINA